jgi:hypothetical protein
MCRNSLAASSGVGTTSNRGAKRATTKPIYRYEQLPVQPESKELVPWRPICQMR